jgi:hypothetical protein
MGIVFKPFSCFFVYFEAKNDVFAHQINAGGWYDAYEGRVRLWKPMTERSNHKILFLTIKISVMRVSANGRERENDNEDSTACGS